MPKGGRLDRCVQHVKESEMKAGKTASEAERIAWAVCKKQTSIKDKKVFVYGEMHFVKGEVDTIRKEVVNLKPNLILLENYEDDAKYYKDKLHGVDIRRLEIVDESLKGKSLLEQFIIRENNMIINIDEALGMGGKIVCIVVGDTHLRTMKTRELGNPVLRNYLNELSTECLTVIYRSQNKEIE